MKSTGCRDVQHTGLQSTQTRRNYSSNTINNTGKQGAQRRGIFEFLSIPCSGCTACQTTQQFLFNFELISISYTIIMHVKQPSSFFSICCNLELISISYNYHAATDVGMLWNSKMPLVCAPCLPVLLIVLLLQFLLVCVLCRPVCWTSLHPVDFI